MIKIKIQKKKKCKNKRHLCDRVRVPSGRTGVPARQSKSQASGGTGQRMEEVGVEFGWRLARFPCPAGPWGVVVADVTSGTRPPSLHLYYFPSLWSGVLLSVSRLVCCSSTEEGKTPIHHSVYKYKHNRPSTDFLTFNNTEEIEGILGTDPAKVSSHLIYIHLSTLFHCNTESLKILFIS